MTEIPGLNADVFFGDPEKPLPDWRAETPDEEIGDEEPDDEPTEDELKAVYGMLRITPEELEEMEVDSDASGD